MVERPHEREVKRRSRANPIKTIRCRSLRPALHRRPCLRSVTLLTLRRRLRGSARRGGPHAQLGANFAD